MATKEERMINNLSAPEYKPSGNSVDLPNYSVVAGAERISGKVGKLVIQNDSTGGTTPQVLNIIYGTAAVGTLTASNYPIGTIYLQYTA